MSSYMVSVWSIYGLQHLLWMIALLRLSPLASQRPSGSSVCCMRCHGRKSARCRYNFCLCRRGVQHVVDLCLIFQRAGSCAESYVAHARDKALDICVFQFCSFQKCEKSAPGSLLAAGTGPLHARFYWGSQGKNDMTSAMTIVPQEVARPVDMNTGE